MTVRHLLPILQEKVKWKEKGRTVILIGARGEVPLIHREPKKPLLEVIPPGKMVLGYELHKSLGLSVGDKVRFLGKEFTIIKCHPERGNRDDITVWINLREAHELLEKKGKISAIMALECYCPGWQLGVVRNDVKKILPGTQVIELATKVLVRAEARHRAEIEAEKASRARLGRQRQKFASLLIPVVLVGSIIRIALLALNNVRERMDEIGVLRTFGLRSFEVFGLFLLRSAVMGFAGAVIGYPVGVVVGISGERLWVGSFALGVHSWGLFVSALVLAPLLACLASLPPTILATQEDPAVVLRDK